MVAATDDADEVEGPGTTALTLCLAAEPPSVRNALRRVAAASEPRLGKTGAGLLELALAEALNNVVEHAYAGQGGPIALSVEFGAGGALCCIRDRGAAIPGGTVPPATPPEQWRGDRAKLNDGGWGWHILRSLAAGLTYRRRGGENVLSFRIKG